MARRRPIHRVDRALLQVQTGRWITVRLWRLWGGRDGLRAYRQRHARPARRGAPRRDRRPHATFTSR